MKRDALRGVQHWSIGCLLALIALLLSAESAFAQSGHEPELRMPEFVAHRGASHLAPENTLASIRLAWEMDADAVEIDIFLISGGDLVLKHDPTLERITGEEGRVEEHTLEELRELDYGAWKGPQWEGEPIPTLDEALATLPEGKRLVVEVKSGTDTVEPMLEAFDRSGHPMHQIVVIAFSYEVAARAKQLRPHLTVYWLEGFSQDEETGEWSPSMEEVVERALEAGLDGVNLRWVGPARDEDAVALIREAGLGFYIWTVNDVDDAQEAIELGVDGITTDRPAWLKGQLLSRNGWRLMKRP